MYLYLAVVRRVRSTVKFRWHKSFGSHLAWIMCCTEIFSLLVASAFYSYKIATSIQFERWLIRVHRDVKCIKENALNPVHRLQH